MGFMSECLELPVSLCTLLCQWTHCCCDTLYTNYLPQTRRIARTRTRGSGTTLTTAMSLRHQRATSWLVEIILLCCTTAKLQSVLPVYSSSDGCSVCTVLPPPDGGQAAPHPGPLPQPILRRGGPCTESQVPSQHRR